jgi:prephenate dehydrogenase
MTLARRLLVVGCGLIGGSAAKAWARAGAVERVIGYDLRPEVAQAALSLGVVHEVAASLDQAAGDVDLVLVAVPVGSIPAVARTLADRLSATAVVTDVGSTKASVVLSCEAVLGGRFVGAHPMAGTERAGPEAADEALFRGRRVLVTPTPKTDPRARALVAQLWQSAGADVVELDATTHDRIVAAVSHLPHVVAYTLVGAIAELGGQGGRDLVGLTGGGFTDTTRIASTPSPMWVDVLIDNRELLIEAVDAFEARLLALRQAIVRGDADAIRTLLEEARAARRRILGE